jgi:DNA-binding transcriptional LysR family regulator
LAYLDNIVVFVRVVELGNLSSAGRALRISPAVASNRVKELEKHLGARLLNRTTRQLTPTEQGRVFYEGAKKVLEAVEEAEAAVAALSGKPRGTIHVTAPLGLGKRLIASGIPEFRERYPEIEVRLRLSDRDVDIMRESIDVAFRLGVLEDSSLRMRGILDCERVLAASPEYLSRRGEPVRPEQLVEDDHDCLLLRFPGAREYFWMLKTDAGPRKFEIRGPFDTDDGDVITAWALEGHGIMNKPRFEIEPYLRDGRLKVILPQNPPMSVKLAAVYPHRNLQDPKLRLLVDFMAERCQRMIGEILEGKR